MSAAALLDRLEGVRKTGPDRWLARCPAHEDRRASLSIKETDDGRTLVHCFALCRADEVIGAVGLDWSALFPVDWAGKEFRKAPRIPASDILKALDFETLVVSVIASDMIHKREISEKDYERLNLARQRISAARSANER
jgi:hypothetical protein